MIFLLDFGPIEPEADEADSRLKQMKGATAMRVCSRFGGNIA